MGMDRRRMGRQYLPLRDAIDQLFENSMIAPHTMSGHGGFPAASLQATEDDVIVELAVPGVNPDQINISVTGDTVTISGEVKRERREQKGQTYLDEIWEGGFQRAFSLPFQVDADRANASIGHGILRLTLPKAESIKPRKIQIRQQSSTIEGQSSQSESNTGTVPVSGNS